MAGALLPYVRRTSTNIHLRKKEINERWLLSSEINWTAVWPTTV